MMGQRKREIGSVYMGYCIGHEKASALTRSKELCKVAGTRLEHQKCRLHAFQQVVELTLGPDLWILSYPCFFTVSM